MIPKKSTLSAIAFILISATALSQPISKQVAISLVKNQIIGNDTLNFNIYMYPSIYPQTFCVCRNGDTIYNPYANARMFFIDKMPHYNWGHTCSYIFIDTTSGNYSQFTHSFFPFGFKSILDSISFACPDTTTWSIIPPLSPTEYHNYFDPNKYAVIFTGDTTGPRWNDISHMYSALKINGFSDENIFLFVPSYEIRDPDYDQDEFDDVDGDCTYENISNTLGYLQLTLTEKDMFYFFCSTHGGSEDEAGNSYLILEYKQNVLNDEALADMVEDFHCSEMIFVIDACYSGGMADDLEGEHSTVQTCTDAEHPFVTEASFGYNFLPYAYATALKGCHPNILQPWTINCDGGTIGEQDLSLVWEGWDNMDDINPDELENGGNGDGFNQTGEAFRYAEHLHYQIANQGINYQNHGTVEDLLSLYGLVGNIDNTQTLSGNFLIGDMVTVKDGVELTIDQNSKIYFNRNYTLINVPQIVVEDNSTLIIEDDVLFWGYDNGNRINIEGSCSIGNNVEFSAPNEIRWSGLNLSNTAEQYDISNCFFNNCNLSANCYELSINSCEFTNSFLDFSYGLLIVENECLFTNAGISVSYPQNQYSWIDISDCNFFNEGYSNGSSIEIDGYSLYLIDNCTIEHDYHSHGIGIFNSGGTSNQKIIKNCEIYNAPSRTATVTDGILIYLSDAVIQENNIHNNGFGIAIYDNSETNVEGKADFTTEDETQIIKNNEYYQLSISDGCFPTKFKWNSVYNKNGEGNFEGIFIRYLSSCDQEDFDVQNNYWGGLETLNDYLYPEGCYDFDPVIQLGQLKDSDITQVLYDSALNLVSSTNYNLAETLYKELIQTYPLSKYSIASMKDLFYLKAVFNQDYQGLQNYYDSLGSDSELTGIHKLAGFLSNQCNIKLEAYQSAINWNDSVLMQPESFEDSIFALIDRDYIYLWMQHENGKSNQLFLPPYVPRTFKEYKVKRDNLLELLKTSIINSTDSDLTEDMEGNTLQNCLNQNYPNPFKDKTTFSFILNENAKVTLIIYDQVGKEIVCFPEKNYTKGKHLINFVNDNLTSGVYFYTVKINNKPVGTKKLMIL